MFPSKRNGKSKKMRFVFVKLYIYENLWKPAILVEIHSIKDWGQVKIVSKLGNLGISNDYTLKVVSSWGWKDSNSRKKNNGDVWDSLLSTKKPKSLLIVEIDIDDIPIDVDADLCRALASLTISLGLDWDGNKGYVVFPRVR